MKYKTHKDNEKIKDYKKSLLKLKDNVDIRKLCDFGFNEIIELHYTKYQYILDNYFWIEVRDEDRKLYFYMFPALKNDYDIITIQQIEFDIINKLFKADIIEEIKE